MRERINISPRVFTKKRYAKPDDNVSPIDTLLRDEFVAAANSHWPHTMRDLCLKYNPTETYGMFLTQPHNRKKPAERLISVEQMIEEEAVKRPLGPMPDVVSFMRLLYAGSLAPIHKKMDKELLDFRMREP